MSIDIRRMGKNEVEVSSWPENSKYEFYIEGWRGKCLFLLSHVPLISWKMLLLPSYCAPLIQIYTTAEVKMSFSSYHNPSVFTPAGHIIIHPVTVILLKMLFESSQKYPTSRNHGLGGQLRRSSRIGEKLKIEKSFSDNI